MKNDWHMELSVLLGLLQFSKQINIALSFSVTDEWLRNKDWTSHPQISFNNRRSLYKHLSWQCGSDAFCLCSMHFVCWPRFQWNSANVWRAVFETCELFMCLKCLSSLHDCQVDVIWMCWLIKPRQTGSLPAGLSWCWQLVESVIFIFRNQSLLPVLTMFLKNISNICDLQSVHRVFSLCLCVCS